MTPEHGTRARYDRGCKCDACRAENNRIKKAYRDSLLPLPAGESLFDNIADAVIARQEPWRAQAACKGTPTEMWFPRRPVSASAIRQAREVCDGCPVKHECAAAGSGQRFGIWGGETSHTRRKTAA